MYIYIYIFVYIYIYIYICIYPDRRPASAGAAPSKSSWALRFRHSRHTIYIILHNST